MKLQTKLLIGFGSLWSVFILATVMALLLLKQQSTELEEAFRSNFDSVDYCSQMVSMLDNYNQLSISTMWTHAAPSPAAIADAEKRFQLGAEGQRRNITLPGEAELTETAFERALDYQQAFAGFVAASDSDRPAMYQSSLLPHYVTARAAVQAVADLNFSHLRTVKQSLNTNLSYAERAEVLFAAVGAALAIASILVLRKTILGPLHSLTQSIRQVEAGNLELTVPVRARDELGELALAFNAMAARLLEYKQQDTALLRRTQQTTQLAIDSLPDAVAVLNPRGEVEISNYQARVHFGLVPKQSAGPEFPLWLRQLIDGPLATGRPVEPQGYQSAVQLFDNGVERFLLPRAVPMFSEAGVSGIIIGVVITLVDVTRLRRADEIKSGLVATVSHELKTPLAAARFSTHMLAQESVGPLNDKQGRLVRAAAEGTDRLHHIIEDLLQFQRFEEGRQQVRLKTVMPRVLVDHAVEPLREEFQRRSLELAIDLPESLPQVTADPDLMSHVLTNLLTNALKFVPAPGTVHISAAAVAGEVHVAIEDTGPGIPPEHRTKLFSRFYRAAAPAETPGAGLGLAIARQLIEAQGGRISVEATAGGEGKGARFLVTLKQAIAAPA